MFKLCEYPHCDCVIGFPPGHEPSEATECPRCAAPKRLESFEITENGEVNLTFSIEGEKNVFHVSNCTDLPAELFKQAVDPTPGITITDFDPVIENVRADLRRRSAFGIKKYGTKLADNPARFEERLQHIYEEILDAANYIQWTMMQIKENQNA